MNEIRRNITKRGKQNPITRRFHAKDDKEAIAAWRSDLSRILHVFNVRSVTSVRSSLNLHFQTELGINTHETISDVHQGAANEPAVVPDVRCNTSNAYPIVSNIYHDKLKNHEGAGGQNQVVSATYTLTE